MDFFILTIREVSYAITHHPLYSSIGGILLFCILLRFYCRLTMGVYSEDQDMTGKTILITGPSEGIGKATAHDLAKRNARLLLACRNLEKANRVVQEIRSVSGNPHVSVVELDLSSFQSVRRCAEAVLRSEEKLHVLINNAGMSGEPRQMTADGCELLMQTNHLGHFLLTMLLLDLLKRSAPSRIINLSSAAHLFAQLDLDDMTNAKWFKPTTCYANTKLLNILFTKELAKRLDGTGVTVNALHPGCVKSKIFRDKSDILSLVTKLLFLLFGKTCEEGAQTTIRLAVDPKLDSVSGQYFSDCKEARPSSAAEDQSLAVRAFEISEQIVGLSSDENREK